VSQGFRPGNVVVDRGQIAARQRPTYVVGEQPRLIGQVEHDPVVGLGKLAQASLQHGPHIGVDLARQREVVDAFLAAARGGNLDALLAVLDPNVVLRTAPADVHGAEAVANRAIRGGARAAQRVLVNGAVGVVVAPRGKLMMVLRFTIERGKIVEIDAVADPERLCQLDLAVL